jgi:aerobic C4-dicarboxylate transport protein
MNIDPSKLDAGAMNTHAANAHKLQAKGSAASSEHHPHHFGRRPARNDVLQVLFFAIIFDQPRPVGERVRRSLLIDAIATVLFKAMGLIVLSPRRSAVAYTGRPLRRRISSNWCSVALFYAPIAIFVVVILGAVMRIAGLNIFKFWPTCARS